MSNRGRHKKSNQHLIIQILGKAIANRIMQYQKEQGNLPNLDIFLKHPSAGRFSKGFTWSETIEGHSYWDALLTNELKNHDLYKKWKNERS